MLIPSHYLIIQTAVNFQNWTLSRSSYSYHIINCITNLRWGINFWSGWSFLTCIKIFINYFKTIWIETFNKFIHCWRRAKGRPTTGDKVVKSLSSHETVHMLSFRMINKAKATTLLVAAIWGYASECGIESKKPAYITIANFEGRKSALSTNSFGILC